MSKNDKHPNPIVLWDSETAECLRLATDSEIHLHYQTDHGPPDGATFGYPGRAVWLARLDPRQTILGWCPDGTPIYRDWDYTGHEYWPGRKTPRVVDFTDAEALAWAHEPPEARDAEGRVEGAPYRAPGARVWCDVHEDHGVAPRPLLDAWRATWWAPDGSPRSGPIPRPRKAA